MAVELNNIIDYQVEAFPKDTVITYMANAEPIMVQTKIVNPEPYGKGTELLLKDLYSEISYLLRKEPYSLMTDEELKKYVLDRTKAVLRYNLFKEINVEVYRITITEDFNDTITFEEESFPISSDKNGLTDIETIERTTEQSYWD